MTDRYTGSFEDIYNSVHEDYDRVVRSLELARELGASKKVIRAMEKAEASLAESLELVNEVSKMMTIWEQVGK